MAVACELEPSETFLPFLGRITAGVALVWAATKVVVVAVLHEAAVEVGWVNRGKGGLFAFAQGILGVGGAGGSSTSGLATVFPRTLEVQTMVVMVLVTWLTVVGGKDEGCKVELRGASRGLGSSVSAVS